MGNFVCAHARVLQFTKHIFEIRKTLKNLTNIDGSRAFLKTVGT